MTLLGRMIGNAVPAATEKASVFSSMWGPERLHHFLAGASIFTGQDARTRWSVMETVHRDR
jgi:hypothetical protein